MYLQSASELERLLKILESSEDRDEKLEALNRIDEIAKTRTDIRYNLQFFVCANARLVLTSYGCVEWLFQFWFCLLHRQWFFVFWHSPCSRIVIVAAAAINMGICRL